MSFRGPFYVGCLLQLGVRRMSYEVLWVAASDKF